MTEYVLGPDEDQETVVKRLLAAAKEPASVAWSPRPNTHPHGGVYVLPDDDADAIIAAVAAEREADRARIQAALDAAAERDAKADETGLTPELLGFPTSTGADPGAPGTEGGEVEAETVDDDPETNEELAQDAADEAIVDDPSTPDVDEAAQAKSRVELRKAARKAAAAAAETEKSE